MKRTALVVGTVLATSVLAAPVALAQAVPTPPVIVTHEKACGTVTLTLDNRDSGDYAFTWSTGPFDGGPIGEQGLIVVGEGKVTTQTIRLPEDSFDGRGFLTLGVSSGPNTHLLPFLDLGLVVTDCSDVDPTPEPTTPPTTTPVPTTPPSVTPTPEPEFVDLNCGDFPLSDGRTAQDVLDETPAADPHQLDENGNRIACETPDVDEPPAVADDDLNEDVVTPSGGVATGGGPA